jgi:hypothetical protein
LNGVFTESEERFNASKKAFEEIWTNRTNATHKIEWESAGNEYGNVSSLYFPKTRCEAVNKTVFAYLETIKQAGENVTMPKYTVNMNEYDLTFNMPTFFIDDGVNCTVNMPFFLINVTGPLAYKDFDDVLLIGSQFFYNYQGIQWNFETLKIAFAPYPPRGNSEDNDVTPSQGKGFPLWLIIVLVIVGVAVLGGLAYYII